MRQDRSAVRGVMRTLAKNEIVVVPLGLEGRGHLLVVLRPRTELVQQVVRTILLENTDRLGIVGADEVGENVSAADVGERADGRVNFPELIRPVPRDAEGTDAAAAAAANPAAVGI